MYNKLQVASCKLKLKPKTIIQNSKLFLSYRIVYHVKFKTHLKTAWVSRIQEPGFWFLIPIFFTRYDSRDTRYEYSFVLFVFRYILYAKRYTLYANHLSPQVCFLQLLFLFHSVRVLSLSHPLLLR